MESEESEKCHFILFLSNCQQFQDPKIRKKQDDYVFSYIIRLLK